MKDLILFGMQGSGKGTQGAILAKKYGYKVFDTGSALRNIAKEDSPLGHKVQEIMNAGNLVSTEIVMEVVADFVRKQSSETPLLFDGIPRSVEQRQQFETILSELNRKPLALYMNLSQESAERRLLSRKMCRSCNAIYGGDYQAETCKKCGGEIYVRQDDNPEAIQNRIQVFFKETEPVLDFYRQASRYVEVDGEPLIEEVTTLIDKKLSSL